MPNGGHISGIEQGRAKYAYDKAHSIAQSNNINLKKEYKSHVKNIPMLIKSNGLGPAFAFVKSKSNGQNSYHFIYTHTSEWLFQHCPVIIVNPAGQADLIDVIIQQNSVKYRQLTKEVLALFVWLKRFADGLIPD